MIVDGYVRPNYMVLIFSWFVIPKILTLTILSLILFNYLKYFEWKLFFNVFCGTFQIVQQHLPGVTADITKSQFAHKLENMHRSMAERIVALEHREIVSRSPVSLIAHYNTILIVIAAASAFVISILTLLVILYRRKVKCVFIFKLKNVLK